MLRRPQGPPAGGRGLPEPPAPDQPRRVRPLGIPLIVVLLPRLVVPWFVEGLWPVLMCCFCRGLGTELRRACL